ncbi:hypothetical protein [Bacillus sp. FJAT-22090]|uniref:hypothetical protein n=1 Tax=Bacillus sp. FJAT-22090 TaxID=1581038 RepID=UPI0016431C7D|nr:hypothetical protein [Bacillus sp. FJAT-22090]
MNGWFLAIVILGVLNVGVNLAKHGQPKEDNYSFWSALFGVLITIGLAYMAIKIGF